MALEKIVLQRELPQACAARQLHLQRTGASASDMIQSRSLAGRAHRCPDPADARANASVQRLLHDAAAPVPGLQLGLPTLPAEVPTFCVLPAFLLAPCL